MEELKNKLKSIKATLSYMQGIGSIDSHSYEVLNKSIEEALLLYNDSFIAINNLSQESYNFGFIDGVKNNNNK